MRLYKGFAPIVQKFVKWVLSECFTIHTFLQNFLRNLIKDKDSGHCVFPVFQFGNCKIYNFSLRLYHSLSKNFCYFSFFSFSGNMNYVLNIIWIVYDKYHVLLGQHLNLKTFSNFSCRFLYPNNFFQFELYSFYFLRSEKSPGTS